MPLSRDFYLNDAVYVAKNLIGENIIREIQGTKILGRIVETEAYMGKSDKACHSYKGKSERTKVLFSKGGKAYIYLVYGMHNCFNVSVNTSSLPQAVLIRAVEPVQGKETMRKFRNKEGVELTNGPAKFCEAFNIDRSLYGTDLCEEETLYIEKSSTNPTEIVSTPRINIDYAEEDKNNPWRFFEKDSKWISR